MQPMRLIQATCVFLTFLAAPMAAAITITFDHNVVHVGGITPGGRVVLFGLAQTSRGGPVVSHSIDVRSEAGGGKAAFQLAQIVPPSSIWAAVDLTNGSYSLATPGGAPLPLGGINAVSGGTVGVDGYYFEFLLVRPNAGVWWQIAGDSGALDIDGDANHHVSLDISKMKSIAGSPVAPVSTQSGDVVVVVDPSWMRAGVIRVTN